MTSLLANLTVLSLAASGPPGGGTPFIRKCCPEGMIQKREGCQPGAPPFVVPDGIAVVYGKPKCGDFYLEKDYEPVFFGNGTASVNGVVEEYCLDFDSLNQTAFFQCFPTEIENYDHLRFYSIGMVVSVPFLFITFVVYAYFKRLRDLQGHCVMYFSFCMMTSYICLIMIHWNIPESNFSCAFLGYAIQFFFMATFFWLNVMCFDIYWAFSGLKHLTGSVKERERKKLILYSCYAWGLPLLILLVTIGIDYSPYVPNDSIFKPGIGVDKCFFQKDQATGIYFYMPMGCVLVINIVLFSITAYRIFTLRRETAVLKRGDSRKHDNTNDKESVNDQGQNFLENKTTSSTVSEVMIEGHKDPYIVKNIRFSLYLKLFLVMGINWVMELLSYLAGGPSYIWYIPDFTNTLQGVFIFIIFVWKERVRKLIWAKMSACCGCKTVSNRSRNDWATSTRNTSTHTSSSGINTSIKMTPTVTNGTTTNQTMTA